MNHGAWPDKEADSNGLARADDVFGADLYRVLTGTGIGRSNLVFSPASISAALRMALFGAGGVTGAELTRALHLDGPVAGPWGLFVLGDLLREWHSEARAAGQDHFIICAPNTIWVQSGLTLQPSFLGDMTGPAAAAVHDADFAREPGKARNEINRVIAEQTAGKIRGLLGPGVIEAATRLVLANAIYLKAAWAHQFPEGATHDAPFYTGGAGSGPAGRGPADGIVTVPTMRVTAQFGYARGDGYQVVLLPYAGVPLAMAIILPDGPLAPLANRLAPDPAASPGASTASGPAASTATAPDASPGAGPVTAAGLQALLGAARPESTRVRLSLPRFRLTSSFGLEEPLRRLGVNRAFTAAADFSGITRAEPLQISAVRHQAYLDVDENGTEAAAATAAAMVWMSAVRQPPPVTVTVDRPFLFAITDTATGLPLFLGQVANPAAP